MFAKTYVRKLTRRDWVLLSICAVIICAVIAVAGVVVGYINNPTNGTAGTDSIVERIKQDGTLAHPYADASQCPPSTDIVIWPEKWHSIPSVPPNISVCFVGKPPAALRY
jgi:hypothetical protein